MKVDVADCCAYFRRLIPPSTPAETLIIHRTDRMEETSYPDAFPGEWSREGARRLSV
jgi:hypothetical protein